MVHKILVALDDSENAMRAVEYIAKLFTPENQVTLFSVILDTAMLCDMNSPELTPYFIAQQGTFCSLEDKKKIKSFRIATSPIRSTPAFIPSENIFYPPLAL
ncbi:MAG: universal stress protein [Pseudomonadota bacterium]|uniref:Universal stress protein n=1 Tax=Candidatus Desulfatibia profunda TaxID=2841695 RepID=A0A8J6NR89_9BACT|nr:universal stress protein [Candidatus Desulfatibia profunda]MBL7181411.1 universal stress protein [Desulfobacterales bacterium]